MNRQVLAFYSLIAVAVVVAGCSSGGVGGNNGNSPNTNSAPIVTNTSAGTAGRIDGQEKSDTGGTDISTSNSSVTSGSVGSGTHAASGTKNVNSSQTKKAIENASGHQ